MSDRRLVLSLDAHIFAAVSRRQPTIDVMIDALINKMDGAIRHHKLSTAWMPTIWLNGVAIPG